MSVKSTDRFRSEFALLVAIVIFAWLVRVTTLQMIEGLGDAFHKWFFAKQLLAGIEVTQWNHHKTRFGINFLTLMVQKIFGDRSMNYYILPIFFSLSLVSIVFAIVKRVAGAWQATIACVLIIVSPQMIREGSQLLPEIFEATYMVATAYCLIRFHQSTTSKLKWVLACACFCFLGYLAKITNLFFLPGILLALGVRRHQLKHTWIFATTLFGLYLIETAAYAIFTEYTLGRLQVISGSYMISGRVYPTTFLGLFDRYTGASWDIKYPIYFFVLSSPFLILKSSKEVRAIVLMALSFLACITFYVKSIDPLSLGIIFRQRYLAVTIPFLAMIIAFAVSEVINRFGVPAQKRPILASVVILVVAGLGVGSRHYPTLNESPIFIIPRYEKIFNAAAKAEIPIATDVSRNRKMYRNLMLVDTVFLNKQTPQEGKIRYGTLDGKRHAYLAGSDLKLEHQKCIVLVEQSGDVDNQGYSIKIKNSPEEVERCLIGAQFPR